MRNYVWMHVIVLAWGFTAILGKLITLPAPDMVVWRTGIAAAGFAVMALFLRVPLRLPWAQALKILGVGWIIGWHWILFFLSARLSTASVSLAVMPTMMIWCSLIEPWINKTRRWSRIELISGVIIVAAVWMIYQVELRYWLGFTVGLVSAVLAAFYAVGSKQLTNRHHYATLCFYQMTGACLAALCTLPFISDHRLPLVPNAPDFGWILLLSLGCTVATYAGYIHLLRRLSVFTVNVIYNMEPIYGIILAALFFGQRERMHAGFYAGALIIIVSVLAVPFWQRRATKGVSAT